MMRAVVTEGTATRSAGLRRGARQDRHRRVHRRRRARTAGSSATAATSRSPSWWSTAARRRPPCDGGATGSSRRSAEGRTDGGIAVDPGAYAGSHAAPPDPRARDRRRRRRGGRLRGGRAGRATTSPADVARARSPRRRRSDRPRRRVGHPGGAGPTRPGWRAGAGRAGRHRGDRACWCAPASLDRLPLIFAVVATCVARGAAAGLAGARPLAVAHRVGASASRLSRT